MEFLRKKIGISGVPQVLLGLSGGLVITLLLSGVFFTLFERPFLPRRVVGAKRIAEIKATVGQAAS